MRLEVVNLGLPKSGTTTLARALRRGGLHVADHRIKADQSTVPALHGAFVGEVLYDGFFNTGDPAHALHEFGAISEMSVLREGRSIWPQTDFALIEALRAHHPGVKFIATRRDAFAMSQSMLGWSNLGTSRLPHAEIPGLPSGYGETTKARVAWIEGHHAHLRRIFAGFDDFLEFDVADPEARGALAAFIGRKLPWWGRINANPLTRGVRTA